MAPHTKRVLLKKGDTGNIVTGIYNRIVDVLKTRFFDAGIYEVVKPVCLREIIRPQNILFQFNKGIFSINEENKPANPGSFYFVPLGKRFSIRYGKSYAAIDFSNEKSSVKNDLEKYLSPISGFQNQTLMTDIYSTVSFGATLHDAASFFQALDLPPVEIPFDSELSYLVRQVCLEKEQNKIGRNTLIENFVQEIVIHICRYLNSLPEFRKNIERVEYLLDSRLVDIVLYIQNNLEKDLSNKSIAAIAYVSEDYVGQFFKSLTNRNLQDYIEDQRLEKALEMLHTSTLNVQEIARRVGFREPAYFSRRFKIKYGENANAFRNVTA